MSKIFLTLLIGFSLLSHSQKKESDYFIIDQNKFLKPIKYILFNAEKSQKKNLKTHTIFYIEGQRFQFIKKKHRIDTCSFKFFEKVKLSQANELSKKEFEFYSKTIRKIKDWEKKAIKAMPINKLHTYFKIFVIEKYAKNKILKYEVDWDYSGTRGLRVE